MRPSPLDEMDAEAYKVGIYLMRHFKRLFPDFYAAHIAQQAVTPTSMRSAIEAFLSLVQKHLFQLEEAYEFWYFADPMRALTYDYGEGPLDVVAEASYFLYQPHAAFYGLGVQSINHGYEDCYEHSYSALTLALWRLFQGTRGGLGVDILTVPNDTPAGIRRELLALTPLPPRTPFRDVCNALVMPDRPWSARIGDLVRYAFGQTDNPLADFTTMEVDEIWGGDTSDEWEDAEGIAESARDAAEIARLYGLWEHAVAAHPKRELAALATALQSAAAPWATAGSDPTALIDLLGFERTCEDTEEEEVEIWL